MDVNFPPDFPCLVDLTDPLGGGVSGHVFYGRDKKTQEERAIKVVDISRLKESFRYAESEIEIMKMLRVSEHPNLVNVFHVCRLESKSESNQKGYVAFVLEYCKEGDLDTLLKKRKGSRLSEKEAKNLMQDFALGLQFLRKKNICHRDLKTKNLLVKKVGDKLVLKIADFGFSKQVVDNGDVVMDSMVGTPHYVAPEVLEKNYDTKSDLWSVGVIFYEILTTTKLFLGTALEIYHQLNSPEEIPLRQELNSSDILSKEGHHLLRNLLRKNPIDRLSWDQFFSHPWLDLESRLKEETKDPFFSLSSPNCPYEIFNPKPLGHGSFAIVYHVLEKKTGKQRALKIINLTKLKTEPKYADSEAEIMEQLKPHRFPSFVRMYETYKCEDGSVALVLELCNAGTLHEYLEEKGSLEEQEAQHLMQDFAAGLGFLKSKNILHRDLKPQNLLLKRKKDGKLILKLGDFGLAKQLDEFDDMMKSGVGTPTYYAPERWFSEKYSAKSDLWATGAILYQMLLGYHPFPAKSFQQMMNMVQNEEVRFPQSWKNPDLGDSKVSPECADLVMKLLQKDPNKRIGWDDFLAHPWLDLSTRPEYKKVLSIPLSTEEIKTRLSGVRGVLHLLNRLNDPAPCFSLCIFGLRSLEVLLPPLPVDGGGEFSDSVKSPETGVSRRQPRTNPFKSNEKRSPHPQSSSISPSPSSLSPFSTTSPSPFETLSTSSGSMSNIPFAFAPVPLNLQTQSPPKTSALTRQIQQQSASRTFPVPSSSSSSFKSSSPSKQHTKSPSQKRKIRSTSFSSSPFLPEIKHLFEECYQNAEKHVSALSRKKLVPSPTQILYENIIEIGKKAVVNELIGSFSAAVEDYSLGCALLQLLLMDTKGEKDRLILSQHLEQFSRMCEMARQKS